MEYFFKHTCGALFYIKLKRQFLAQIEDISTVLLHKQLRLSTEMTGRHKYQRAHLTLLFRLRVTKSN